MQDPIFERLVALEQQVRGLADLVHEREAHRMEREGQRERRDEGVASRESQMLTGIRDMTAAMKGLTSATKRHLLVKTCLEGTKQAVLWGSMGGGVVSVVVLIGKLLGFW